MSISFDPEITLSGKMDALSPGEAIALGIALCRYAEDKANGAFHGGIWPGNISFDGVSAAIGPYEPLGLKEMGPDALEYIAPEQFWNGEMSPASDVYSIGLVLYTALNGGRMPFFEDKPVYTAEDRAAALQKRMRGGDMVYPRSACRELGDIVLCATEFKAADRYPSPASLRTALEALPEEAAIPAVAPVIRLKPREVEAVHSYKVDKSFEKTVPGREAKAPKRRATVDEDMDVQEFRKPKVRRSRWFMPAAIGLIVIIALILVFKGCSADEPENNFDFEDEPGVTEPVASTSPEPQTTPSVVITEPDPVVSDDPGEEEDPPAEPRYTIFMDDVTWEEARASCEQMGGHLATVNDQETLDAMIAMAVEKGAQFVWLGAYRGGDGIWYNVTGETMSFSAWDTGEPSAIDADGTREDYLLLWYRPAQGTWSYNDMRNDPISVIPATYSGKVAYICQFD